MLQKHYLTVQKTARYFTHGVLNENTKYIWLVIHGYAQTAENFISSFANLSNEHFVIAPEGLNRFYSRGFSGNPVASWMTSLERESEINDYLNYLNQLLSHFTENLTPKPNILLLGFSQGVSTQTRFLNQAKVKIDYSVMVAGEIGKEFQEKLPHSLITLKSLFLIGNEENILKTETLNSHKILFEHANCEFKEFLGKHEFNENALIEILKHLS